MRNLCAVLLSATLVTTGAFAAGSNSPLAPGKPAGVKQAQAGSTVALIVGGTAAVVMAAAMIGGSGGGGSGGVSNPNGGNTGATTTTAT